LHQEVRDQVLAVLFMLRWDQETLELAENWFYLQGLKLKEWEHHQVQEEK
jgi:hypothetical protein